MGCYVNQALTSSHIIVIYYVVRSYQIFDHYWGVVLRYHITAVCLEPQRQDNGGTEPAYTIVNGPVLIWMFSKRPGLQSGN